MGNYNLKVFFFFFIFVQNVFSQNNESNSTCFDGLKALKSKNYILALRSFDDCVLTQPNETENYYLRGLLYYKCGQYIDALNDFNQVVKMDSTYKNVFNLCGIAKANLGEWEEGLDFFYRALSVRGTDTGVIQNINTLEAKLKNEEEYNKMYDERNSIFENTESVSYIDFINNYRKSLVNGELKNVFVKLILKGLDKERSSYFYDVSAETFRGSKQIVDYYGGNQPNYSWDERAYFIVVDCKSPVVNELQKHFNKYLILNIVSEKFPNNEIYPTVDDIIAIQEVKTNRPKNFGSVVQQFETEKAPTIINRKEIFAQISNLTPIPYSNRRIITKLLVNELGNIINVSPKEGDNFLDYNIQSILYKCKFTPALLGGNTVKCWVSMPIQFK